MKSNNRIAVAQGEGTGQVGAMAEHLYKRKQIWMIFSIVGVVCLIILSISMVILNAKKGQVSTTATNRSRPPTTPFAIGQSNSSTPTIAECFPSCLLTVNSQWKQTSTIVAGGHAQGNGLNQLSSPYSIDLDEEEQCMYIADASNHRVVRWKFNTSEGEIIAGGNGKGKQEDQLDTPLDAIRQNGTDSLVVCDNGNKRVVRWSLKKNRQPEILLSDIVCWGLAEDSHGHLYVAEWSEHRVIRWKEGQTSRKIVAGGNGGGDRLDQLGLPRFIFVDSSSSIYIADSANSRVMKWTAGATNGQIIVDRQISELAPDYHMMITSVFVDWLDNVYFSDTTQCRVSRWTPTALKETVLVGEKECSYAIGHFVAPHDITFDRKGNLYVVDTMSFRIQKFQLN